MAKVRQDAWSHEDDLLLAETVLRHIREGSTQLNAFEEVGDKLNRTSAACGFRWNAEVRQRYEQAVDIAKRQRKEKKRTGSLLKKQSPHSYQWNSESNEPLEQKQIVSTNIADNTTNSIDKELTMHQVIVYLKTVKKELDEGNRSQKGLQRIEEENKHLRQEKEDLQKKVIHLEKQLETVQTDYQAFLQIMDRARKMIVFQDQDDVSAPAFRMEKNGNLEQVAK